MMPRSAPSDAPAALLRLEAYLERTGFRGYDPYDALASPPLGAIGVRSRRVGQLITQANRLSPVNLRPLLGVPRSRNAKAAALFALAVRARFDATGEQRYETRARALLAELSATAAPGGGWGYTFPWANRSFFAPAGTPNAVVTSFVLQAFAAWPSPEPEPAVEMALTFLGERLRWSSDHLGVWVSYTPGDDRRVYNVNALVGVALVRSGEPALAERGAALVNRVVAGQRSDGSWPYGTAPGDAWVDGFHTGFVLRSLRSANGERYGDAIRLGVGYYRQRLLDRDGAARASPARRYPVDAHAWAEALLVAEAFQLPESTRIAAWGIRHLLRRDGHITYQKGRLFTNVVSYHRWANAWSYLALARHVHATAPEPASHS